VNNNIQGKVVVITGASSGLGEATARRLSADGATVVLDARRIDRIEALAGELTQAGGKALAVATDATHAEQVKALVGAAVQAYGRVDVVINNAGQMPHSPLERLKIKYWNRTIDVNIKGVLYGIAAALPHMQRQKSGQIVNVSSVAGRKAGALSKRPARSPRMQPSVLPAPPPCCSLLAKPCPARHQHRFSPRSRRGALMLAGTDHSPSERPTAYPHAASRCSHLPRHSFKKGRSHDPS